MDITIWTLNLYKYTYI